MFAPIKYIGIDYFYEKVARERLSFQCLAIHIPSCLYQDKNYYHDGGCAHDKYRRPWTRVSIDSTQLTFSVLDFWKKCLYIEDFLEKKPMSCTCFHIHNEDVEIVPSSNPCSPFDIEEAYILTKDGEKQKLSSAKDLQSSSAPIVVEEQGKGLYIEDELVFTDYLVQYTKWLPTLQMLLSRLSIFYVEDPLLNSAADHITEEDIFRECFIFKRSMTLLFGEEPHEDFCKVSLRDEEICMLPMQLPFYKAADFRLQSAIPSYLALKSLFQVTPEVTGDEKECCKIISEDFRAKIMPETMGMSDCCSTQNVHANKNTNVLEFSEPASYTSSHLTELEVPLTPPSGTEKLHVNLLCMQLQPEPVSPFGKSDLIPESITEYLENLMWQSEKYQHPMNSLLLTGWKQLEGTQEQTTARITLLISSASDQGHQNFVPLCQQLLITELKTLLSVHEDISVFSSLEEDDWINLRGEMASPCILEAFSTDLNDEKRLVCIHEEAFSKIAHFQLDKCLTENISFAKTTVKSFGIPECSGTKNSCWSPLKKEIFSQFHLEPATTQYNTAAADNIIPTENHVREVELGGEIGTLSSGNQEGIKNDEFQLVSFKDVSVGAGSIPQNKRPVPLQLTRKSQDNFDLLSNFIMLRSKHVITQSEKTNNEDIQEEVPNAKEENPAYEDHNSPIVLNTTGPMKKQTEEKEATASIEIKPSESQFQAYLILEAAVDPVLQDLTALGMCNWKFTALNFDDSRFFLKQQEKVMNDTFKDGVMGAQDRKDITLFKHAATLHLLVTVRDLLLTCNLKTALGYLSKAKDSYKNFLGSSLDGIWRQLKIVQCAIQKHEANPKITELKHQMSKWVHSNTDDHSKVVIVIRMDFDEEIADLINIINTVQGLKIAYLHAEKRTLLESKNVISSLQRYSCVVVRNQHIGPDFPWTDFSLVVEYNYSENSCWADLCKNLNVSYITFKTALPEAAGIDKAFSDNFGCVFSSLSIPYVFLTSEGLINTPEILQLLESKYNVTFIERSCCEVLQYFGSTERYVVMTIDERTVLVMQNVEELNYEKSSDNIVLRLMVLSLQYSSCWIILYSREGLSSQYSLGGKTLHHLALIYAALVPFSQKSEDFDVKVALTPGIEETAFLIRGIADYTLLTSKRNPQEWLDKAWLSVLPSEEETCLLTFPCINPLVAQVMLKKSSSLEWLLSATFAQLQQLLPEVPEKVMKHFSDITSLYTLKPLSESKPVKEPMPAEGKTNSAISSFHQLPNSEALLSSFQESDVFNECSGCSPEVQKRKSSSSSYCQNELSTPLKSTTRHNLIAPSISYIEDTGFFQNITESHQCLPLLKQMETDRKLHASLALNNLEEPKHISFEASMPYLGYNQSDSNSYLDSYSQNRIFLSKVAGDQKLEMPVLLKNSLHQDVKNVCEIKKRPHVKQCHSAQDFRHSWYLDSNKDGPLQQSSDHFLGEFEGLESCSSELQSKKRFGDEHLFLKTMDSSFHGTDSCKAISNLDGFFNMNFQMTGEYAAKKRLNLSSNQREQYASAGLEFAQLPQLKKRRLTFEKDPERSDGQTRLKFF